MSMTLFYATLTRLQDILRMDGRIPQAFIESLQVLLCKDSLLKAIVKSY